MATALLRAAALEMSDLSNLSRRLLSLAALFAAPAWAAEALAQANEPFEKDRAADHAAVSGALDYGEVRVGKGDEALILDGSVEYGTENRAIALAISASAPFGERFDEIETQLKLSQRVSNRVWLTGGVRHDIVPNPSRTFALAGAVVALSNQFEVEALAFVSDRGDLFGRVGAVSTLPVAGPVVLACKAEINFAAQDIADEDLGRGASDYELGLRLGYELDGGITPYAGVVQTGALGRTVKRLRAIDEPTRDRRAVFGLSIGF